MQVGLWGWRRWSKGSQESLSREPRKPAAGRGVYTAPRSHALHISESEVNLLSCCRQALMFLFPSCHPACLPDNMMSFTFTSPNNPISSRQCPSGQLLSRTWSQPSQNNNPSVDAKTPHEWIVAQRGHKPGCDMENLFQSDDSYTLPMILDLC